jgi:hypothetical protein
MRTVLAAAASVALLAAPLAITPSQAQAQSRGGGYHGGGGGGFHGGGGNGGMRQGGFSSRGASSPSFNRSSDAVRSGGGAYRGGASYARGRYAGGYRSYAGRRGYYGYGGYPYFYGGLGLGLALGATYAYNDPWFYGYDGYYGGYGAPDVISERQTYVSEPPPADYGPDGAYALQNQRPQANAPTGTACGAWKWDESETTYHWIPC